MVHCSTVHVLFYHRRISLCTSNKYSVITSNTDSKQFITAATMEVLVAWATVSLAKLLSILGDVPEGVVNDFLWSLLLFFLPSSFRLALGGIMLFSMQLFSLSATIAARAQCSRPLSQYIRSFRARSTHAVRLPSIALGRSTDRIVAVQSQYTRATLDRA